jgi:hypothetical protein
MRWLAPILTALVLAGCAAPQPDIRGSLTRERIDARTETIMLVELPEAERAALVTPWGRNGSVATWRSPDNVSLSYDGGVLVATRGLGNDLMTSDVAGTRAALAGASGRYERFQTHLNGEGETVLRAFSCEMAGPVPEALTIFGLTQQTQRYAETCNTLGFAIENSYWLANGVMWKAREWAGPGLGYVSTERLSR